MTLLSALRRIALLLVLGLCPAFAAAALNETYEGLLIPDSFETPIPITVEIRELSGLLLGQVKTGSPFTGSAPITGGENEYGKCNVRVNFPSGNSLKLAGTCLPNVFEGRYTLIVSRKDSKLQGSFHLLRKETRADSNEKKPSLGAPLAAPPSLTECIKSNTRCLIGCPRGDYNAEFLCSNRCRHKFQSCKGKNSQPVLPAVQPAPVEQN